MSFRRQSVDIHSSLLRKAVRRGNNASCYPRIKDEDRAYLRYSVEKMHVYITGWREGRCEGCYISREISRCRGSRIYKVYLSTHDSADKEEICSLHLNRDRSPASSCLAGASKSRFTADNDAGALAGPRVNSSLVQQRDALQALANGQEMHTFPFRC